MPERVLRLMACELLIMKIKMRINTFFDVNMNVQLLFIKYMNCLCKKNVVKKLII
ncbi:hypothetical protein CHRYSEO8AT_440149 [Chryseobacterium sp. 8AT]|nr:hypothetical protein CHRYSEO8AT_440149 [Chryseobacterium sp. 8AT]